jgi:hypothetical protein
LLLRKLLLPRTIRQKPDEKAFSVCTLMEEATAPAKNAQALLERLESPPRGPEAKFFHLDFN